jgi:hypothetical protein
MTSPLLTGQGKAGDLDPAAASSSWGSRRMAIVAVAYPPERRGGATRPGIEGCASSLGGLEDGTIILRGEPWGELLTFVETRDDDRQRGLDLEARAEARRTINDPTFSRCGRRTTLRSRIVVCKRIQNMWTKLREYVDGGKLERLHCRQDVTVK